MHNTYASPGLIMLSFNDEFRMGRIHKYLNKYTFIRAVKLFAESDRRGRGVARAPVAGYCSRRDSASPSLHSSKLKAVDDSHISLWRFIKLETLLSGIPIRYYKDANGFVRV